MSTITIIMIAAICCLIYTVIVGWMAKSYRSEIKREYEAKMKDQGVKLINKDIHILMLEDSIKYHKRAYKQYVNDSNKEREELHKLIKLLTPTESDAQ